MEPVLHQISDLEEDRAGLPCHTRLSNPIRARFQQWGYHGLPQKEPVEAERLRGTSAPEECLSEWAHIGVHPGGITYGGVHQVFR